MSRLFAVASFLLISVSAHAETLVDLTVGEITHKVIAADYRNIERSLKQVSTSLEKCTPAYIVYKDVIINRSNSYVIKDGGAYCNIILIKDLSWVYSCKLTVKDTTSLAASINKRIDSRELLGDLTPTEQAIFFNQKKCAVEEL